MGNGKGIDKKSFLLYCDQAKLIEKLSDEQAGFLIKQVYKYCDNGRKRPEINDPVIDIVFTSLQTSLDRDHEKYLKIVHRNRSNGASGGRPTEPKKPSGLSGNPKNPVKPDSGSDSGNDSGSETDVTPKPPKKKFIPPTVEEVQYYFVENGYKTEAGKRAWEYYEAGVPPWHDSRGTKIKGWKQKMRGVWFKQENKINGKAKNRIYVGTPTKDIPFMLTDEEDEEMFGPR